MLAEDQGILRSSLTVMLGIEPDIQVVASAANRTEALRAVGLHLPAVLVTDIEMPQLTGLDLAARVKELYPATWVLILTTFARPGYLRRALDAGAIGYLLKDCPSTEMAEAVRRVARGERVIDPGLAAESSSETYSHESAFVLACSYGDWLRQSLNRTARDRGAVARSSEGWLQAGLLGDGRWRDDGPARVGQVPGTPRSGRHAGGVAAGPAGPLDL